MSFDVVIKKLLQILKSDAFQGIAKMTFIVHDSRNNFFTLQNAYNRPLQILYLVDNFCLFIFICLYTDCCDNIKNKEIAN